MCATGNATGSVLFEPELVDRGVRLCERGASWE